MKNLFYIFIFLLTSFAAFANHRTSEIVFLKNDSKKLSVVIDNQVIQSQNNEILFDNIEEGQHTVRLYRWYKKHNTSTAYKKLISQSVIQVESGMHYEFVLTQNNKLKLIQWYALDGEMWDQEPNECQDTPNFEDYHNATPTPYCVAMDPISFNKLLLQIEKEPFDENRRNIVSQALRYNNLIVSQVMNIMQVFSFDESRLWVAQTAYPSTCNYQDYYQLFDAFTFSSTSNDLDAFLKAQQ